METPMLQEQAVTLLIVDDEPLMTDLFHKYMTKRGFQVLTATSGKEALELLNTRAGIVNLVLTDMTMPDMDGLTLARALAERLPHLPVLIATGHDKEVVEQDLPPTVISVIRKPYQNKTLAERIREILGLDPAP